MIQSTYIMKFNQLPFLKRTNTFKLSKFDGNIELKLWILAKFQRHTSTGSLFLWTLLFQRHFQLFIFTKVFFRFGILAKCSRYSDWHINEHSVRFRNEWNVRLYIIFKVLKIYLRHFQAKPGGSANTKYLWIGCAGLIKLKVDWAVKYIIP